MELGPPQALTFPRGSLTLLPQQLESEQSPAQVRQGSFGAFPWLQTTALVVAIKNKPLGGLLRSNGPGSYPQEAQGAPRALPNCPFQPPITLCETSVMLTLLRSTLRPQMEAKGLHQALAPGFAFWLCGVLKCSSYSLPPHLAREHRMLSTRPGHALEFNSIHPNQQRRLRGQMEKAENVVSVNKITI